MTESTERLEREAFEAWCLKARPNWTKTDQLYWDTGICEYAGLGAQVAFEAWQERARRAPAAGALYYPEEPFAIVTDRTYEGEGPSLAVWNGENYSFSDGDCYEREADGSLDGFDTEWLTHYQVDQRLFAGAPIAWFEAEEKCRGADLRSIINGILHSTRWHWQAERPETGNPVWPVFDSPQPAAVPNGWKLVPIEPTNEMQAAAAQAIRFDTTLINKLWTGNAVLRSGIAAAPAAPKEK